MNHFNSEHLVLWICYSNFSIMQAEQVAFMHLGICIHVVLQMCMEQWRERPYVKESKEGVWVGFEMEQEIGRCSMTLKFQKIEGKNT